MARRYLVFSDLHLADVEDHPDGWKAFKHSRFTYDDELDELVRRFVEQAGPNDDLTLILNGDIIDFDLVSAAPGNPPWPVSASERKRVLEPTEEKSIWKLRRILADHPTFVDTLARFVAAGHLVVYVVGNHDPEFHFPGVCQAFVDTVAERACVAGLALYPPRIRFEPWFYYVPGEIYVEHGHQYDYYSAMRFPLCPMVTTDDPPTIALAMGNLANRYLMTNMGYFNPNSGDFILNVYGYLTHWLKYYAFTRRGLVFNWLFGSLLVLLRLLRTKRKLLLHPPDIEALHTGEARRKDLPLATIKTLSGLHRPPMSSRVYRMVREFWIDRLLLAVVMTWGTIVLALAPVPLWVKLMVPLSSFPLLYLVYEWFAHGETIFSIERDAHQHALAIARLLPVKLVTFGHTHVPEVVPLLPGVSYINTGTWAPLFEKKARPGHEVLRTGLQNVLVACFDDDRGQFQLDSCVEDPLGGSEAS